MLKTNVGQNFVNFGLSYLALTLNLLEQIGLITSKFSILPNFFVQIGGGGTQIFAGFLSLILSGVVIAILWFGFSNGLNIDYRGFVVKKGKMYTDDIVIPFFWMVIVLILIEVLLIAIYVSVGLGAIGILPVWLQYDLQLLAYVFFWALLTYFFSYFLKNHMDKSKYEEDRRQYIYDLFETIERSNAIKGDSKLSVKATFTVQYIDRLNFVVARNKHYLVQTSLNASELRYVLEVLKQDFDKELKNLIDGGTYPLSKMPQAPISV